MDAERIERIAAWSRRYLQGRSLLYPPRKAIRFDLGDHYTGIDRMLGREILYARLDVRERWADCRVVPDDLGWRVRIEADPAATPPGRRFLAHLAARGRTSEGSLGILEHGKAHKLHARLGDFALVLDPREEREGLLEMDVSFPGWSDASTELSASSFNPSERLPRLVDWLREVVAEWAGGDPAPRIEAVEAEGGTLLRIWRGLSRIDIDSSGEEPPDVFRWQESGLLEDSTWTDLDQPACLAILSRNGVSIPDDARPQGISELDLGDGAGCVAMRWGRFLPDPEFQSHAPAPSVHRHPEWIVVEGDFREVHLDARRKLVIGECWKWRNLPEPP